jgi:hydroxyacylglutathione hydrolase
MESKKLTILTFPVGQMQTNCYFLIHKKSKDTFVIDPGDDGDYLSQKIVDLRLHPVGIIATHGHFDHIMAVSHLQYTFQIPFIMSKKDTFLVQQMPESAMRFLHIKTGPSPEVDLNIDTMKQIRFTDINITVIPTPGHTPGGVCLHIKKEKVLFSGDVIFEQGAIGRYDFLYSDRESLISSVVRVLKLPAKTVIFSGHGGVTSVEKERVFGVQLKQ